MKHAVLDCSAAIRLYVPDGPIPPGTEEAIDLAWQGELALICPELFLAEAAQVVWKKEKRGQLTPLESDQIAHAIATLPLEVIAHRELLTRARQLARQSNLTVYDSLYLVLAQNYRAPLLTADEALAKHATA